MNSLATSQIVSPNSSPNSSPTLKKTRRLAQGKTFKSSTIVVPKSGIDYQNRNAFEKGREAEDLSTRRHTPPDTISELITTCTSPMKKGRRLVTKTVTEHLGNSCNPSSSLVLMQTDTVSK